MSIEKNFDIPFVADLALLEKQIQQNYRPVIAIHKWFARRPGTLFRALLLSEFVQSPLIESFFRSNNFKGVCIADPFMDSRLDILVLFIYYDPRKEGRELIRENSKKGFRTKRTFHHDPRRKTTIPTAKY